MTGANEAEAIYASISGGSELVAWFGRVPSFHDAEIVGLNLNRRSASTLVLHTWSTTNGVDDRGYFVLDRHVAVTFVLEEILDLELNGFSHQNVVFGLVLRRAPGS
jgi:Immunity protein 50